MHSTKYRELVALLILLDEVELRSRALAERFPELFNLARKGMLELAKRLASGKEDSDLVSALRNQLPKIERQSS